LQLYGSGFHIRKRRRGLERSGESESVTLEAYNFGLFRELLPLFVSEEQNRTLDEPQGGWGGSR
jgi:hypothetical protein